MVASRAQVVAPPSVFVIVQLVVGGKVVAANPSVKGKAKPDPAETVM